MRTNLKQICKTGGHGDRIMASVRTNDEPWYVKERTEERWYFNDAFKVRPGRIALNPALLEWAMPIARNKILIEPHIKGTASADNKDWGWHNWLEVARDSRLPLLQCIQGNRDPLPGVEHIHTPSFEHALACLAVSEGMVTTEGGMHHAAAALGRPAVVIFGAFNSPALFGYPTHINIASPDPEGLGWRKPNKACRDAMNRITPNEVMKAMNSIWT